MAIDPTTEPPQPGPLVEIVFWLLLFVVAAAPIPFGSNRPWAWSLLSLLIAGLVIIWAIAAIIDPKTIQLAWGRCRPPAVLFIAFMVWSLYQAAGPAPQSWWAPGWLQVSDILHDPVHGYISANPERSMTGIMRLLAYAGIFWIAVQVGRRTRYAKAALWSVIISGAAYAIYGLVTHLEGSETILGFLKWSYGGALTATFVNRNHFAIYAGLSILCTLALIADQTRQATEASISSRSGFIQFLDNMSMQLVFLAITFMMLATALILTQSRSGVLMTAISIVGFLVVLATTSTFAAKSVIRFGIVILLAGGLFSIISGSMLAARFSGATESLSDRLTIYMATLRAIGDRPLLGFGLGSFGGVFPHYRGAEFAPNDPTYDYAHNIYLELIFEAGIPGALLLIGAMVIIIGICLWGARSRHRNGYIPALGFAASLLVGGHGLFDFSLQIPAIAAVYCLILGVAYSQSWSTGLANSLTHD